MDDNELDARLEQAAEAGKTLGKLQERGRCLAIVQYWREQGETDLRQIRDCISDDSYTPGAVD